MIFAMLGRVLERRASMQHRFAHGALIAVLFVSGCGLMHPDNSAAQAAVSNGIELYNDGDYRGAIKRLADSNEIWKAETPVQLKALKYMAFSYCVTGRQTLCEQQFEKALKLDPAFNLKPGEKGHPLWGPAFERAKRECRKAQ
jgi:hypothetical protein